VFVTGADQWATEVVPNPNKDLAFPVHGQLICKNGIYNHENLEASVRSHRPMVGSQRSRPH
jgi:hypothetical protein